MIKLFSDGGARGNPGPAAIGAIGFNNDTELFRIHQKIGNATNNIAEYKALIAGLKKLIESRQNNIVECNLDSELIVKQLNGQYKVKNSALKQLFMQVNDLKKQFNQIFFHHIVREKNKIADSLVNKALDS